MCPSFKYSEVRSMCTYRQHVEVRNKENRRKKLFLLSSVFLLNELLGEKSITDKIVINRPVYLQCHPNSQVNK